MPSQHPHEYTGACATLNGASMPARRPVIEQITKPQFTPELIRRICTRLNKHIDELEQTLAEARS